MDALRGVDGVSPACSIHSVAIGEEIEHPFSQSIAFMWATLAASGTRDYARARERAEALLQLADRRSFPIWRGCGDGGMRRLPGVRWRDRIRSQADRRRTGLAAPRRQWQLAGIHTCDSRGGPHAIRQPRSCARAADGSDRRCQRSNARVLLPEIERLHAEVLLLTGQIDTPQAIVRIEAAAAHARQQGALALEWRATMALARLYACVGRDRGTQATARQLCGVHARVCVARPGRRQTAAG
jgi:hypothetical protein